MHEMSIAEGIFSLVEEYAKKENAKKVKLVGLEIGELAAIEVEALKLCFGFVSKNTIAENAIIETEIKVGIGWCKNCEKNVPMKTYQDCCQQCGNYKIVPITGSEMRVKYIDVI